MAAGCQKYICNSSRSACTLTKEAFHMLKKNTRKRLLAGALATVMMLTMCPSWALADDEDIALLPANEEIAVPVVDSTPAADPTETPAVPTPSEPEAKPAEDQNTAPAPSDDGANGGTDSTESGNNTNPTIPEASENNSQNNDVVSNSPANAISLQETQIDLAWNWQPEAKYFVLLPNRDKPTSGESQGPASYLPNETSDGGVTRCTNLTGYKGHLTAKGKKIADKHYSIHDATNGYTKIDDVGVESEYLDLPENLGFFTPGNWSNGSYNDSSADTSILGENFNVNNIRVVWYTIKKQVDGYHVDGYVAGVPVKVTYHSNYGTIPGMTDDSREVTAMSGETHTVLNNMFTVPTGFSFGGWYVDDTKYEVGSDHLLMTDLHLYAKWDSDKYTVTWESEGEKLGDEQVAYNQTPKKTFTPKKKSTSEFDYEFVGWKVENGSDELVDPNTTPVTENVTYVAVFEPVTRQYTVTWKSENNVLGTQEVNYNEKPTNTYEPTKAEDDQFSYTFKGWNVEGSADTALVTPTDIAVTANVTYIAVFEPVAREYHVTYLVGGTEYAKDTYKVGADVAIRPVPTKDGYTFTGWTSNDSAFDIRGFKMPAHNVVIEGKFEKNPAKQYTYTVNKHFYDEKGVEVNVEKGEAKTAVENTAVSELYKDAAVKQTVDGKTYVYVSGLTTVTDNLEKLTKDVTIDLYYYLNVEGGNDIPDAWEYRLTFKVVNGEWNDGGNADIVTYVQFKDQTTGEAFKDEAVVVPVTRIPAVGDKPNSGYHAGAWDTSPYDNYKVQKDTVFTYTYAKNSSGGSSGGHHRRPTVTIPDDVPTGLNGDDHYAYIVGYPDKTVRPQNGITRAEVATIFFRLLTDETRDANSTKSNSYSDVAAGAWYNHAVSTLSAMGIVKGSNGKFNPNAPITRAEFAAIAARFDDKANTTTADFSDIASHWAKNEISAASNNGWITGYPDGTFRPDNKITRAEAMTLVNRVLKRLPETEEDLHDDMIKWSDNSDVSQWFYLDVQEATNSHYYQTKENQFEKWTKLRETRDWTELEK